MNYQEAAPFLQLSKFIKCFWALEFLQSDLEPAPEPVLPDGCPEIVFNLSDRFVRVYSDHEELQPTALFAGQMNRSIVIRPTGSVKLFGVRFRPAGAHALMNFSIDEITDRIVDLKGAFGSRANRLEDKVNEAKSFADRVAVFEGFVLASLSSKDNNSDTIAFAASEIIERHSGLLPVATIAERLGISDRKLERHFKRTVGLAPKTFSKIVRFQSLLKAVQRRSDRDLLDVALAFGYYDQSHLIRDFNILAGDAPLAFLDRTHNISDLFTGTV